MAQEPTDRETIRKYLLADLAEPQQQALEKRLLSDNKFLEELEIVEDELIDEYWRGELDAQQTIQFQSVFLAASERRNKLRFGRIFMDHVALQADERVLAQVTRPSPAWWSQTFASPVRIAVYALVIAGIAVGTWLAFFRQSDVDRGLIALSEAYRQQRPIEARISQFDYAPYVVTRGDEQERVDALARDRAELTLLNAVREKPTADSYHALGKAFLAKREFDKAIEQFVQALKLDADNAQVYADLGAAWLEKGKASLGRGEGNPNSPELGQGMEELGRSLDNLNRALRLDNTLLEALFNRALAQQSQKLYQQAEQDWLEYLKRDSTSPWSDEARRNLKLLEERKARTSGTKQQLIVDFYKAYKSGDDRGAWAAMSLSRARTGNAVVEGLIDDSLNLAATGRQNESREKLQILSYAGELEFKSVQDRFSRDLAAVYHSATTSQRDLLQRARQLRKSGIDFYNRAEWQQAIKLFSESRELLAQAGNEAEVLFSEAWIGYCHLRIPDPTVSLELFERLSRIFEAKNYRSLFAQTVLAIADSQNAQNEYSRVLERARQSLGLSEQIDDRANAVRCLQASTSVQIIVGNYRESLAATFRALSIAEQLPTDAKLIWPFYHEASIAFYFLEMPEVGLQFEIEALRIATAAGLSLQTSRSHDRLAVIFGRMGNYSEALKHSELAKAAGLKIADERSRTNILAHSALNYARLYRDSGDPQRSLSSYDEALALYEKLGLDIYQYSARKGKFQALLATNNVAAAETELGNVLEWFEENREKDRRGELSQQILRH